MPSFSCCHRPVEHRPRVVDAGGRDDTGRGAAISGLRESHPLSGSEQPFSRLYDRRWIEVLTTHLKQLDAYLDARKKLGSAQTPTLRRRDDQQQGEEERPPLPGRKGEGKKGRGRDGREKSEKPAAEAAKTA